jgi:outer membrane protein assembly factor BamD (BamD/ComL family)
VLTAKKKIVKKDAGEAQSAYSWNNIQAMLIKHGKTIGVVFTVILIAIVALYFYQAGLEEDNIQASRELSKVQTLYQQGQYKLAITGDPSRGIPGLQEIAASYSGTETGDQATLFLANCYLYTEDYDKAIATFGDASPSSDLLEAAVEAGIATAYFNKGEFAAAAEQFEKAARTFENDIVSTDRFLAAAKAYLKAGNKEAATEMLQLVKEAKTTKHTRDVTRIAAEHDIELN